MKTLTVTLDDELADVIERHAIGRGLTTAALIEELARTLAPAGPALSGLDLFLALPGFPAGDEPFKMPSREEIYDRAVFRRHERPDLRTQSE